MGIAFRKGCSEIWHDTELLWVQNGMRRVVGRIKVGVRASGLGAATPQRAFVTS